MTRCIICNSILTFKDLKSREPEVCEACKATDYKDYDLKEYVHGKDCFETDDYDISNEFYLEGDEYD